MSIYTIKKVPSGEVDKLVSFIDNHWKKGHALVKSRALLDFQHYNKKEDTYNFIVAENNETREYDALVGFIPTSQYDSTLEENGDYWGAIWKCREDVTNTEINNAAFFIWKIIFKQPFFHSYSAIGISNIAKRIYEVSRIPVDVMRQYFIANDSITNFHIGINLKKGNTKSTPTISTIREIDIEKESCSSVIACYRPYKSLVYFENRYNKHPIYHYLFWGIYSDELKVILVVRKVRVNDSFVLRIVDVLGDLSSIGNLYESIQEQLKSHKAEYVDFMNYGLPESLFYTLGFQKLDLETDEIIVPNYFEPFEQRNVKLEVAFKSDYPYVAFKGDSDQDRPNIL